MHVSCPIQTVFNFLSKRWMLLILRSVHEGRETFGDVKRSLGTISSKILSERLSELELEGYITRMVTDGRPVKIRYSITEKGTKLGDCIISMEAFIKETI